MSETRLPAALTPILGRSRELSETARLLSSTRLLTITGSGGSGKTRLALELAHRVVGQFETAYWIELAPIADAEQVGQQILDVMRVRGLTGDDALRAVIDALGPRKVLLVVDNCEHVIEGAAVAIEEILRNAPGTFVLATSREALGITGEYSWLLPPLSQEDAVALFDERARAALPSALFSDADRLVIAQICQRLDGIPLAIELAAARVRVLPLQEIAARLDDAFRLLSSGSRTVSRHRTIRETIDWSHRLLSTDEQILLRRLSVFPATFPLPAAEAVCGDIDVLTHLTALVDKSLLMSEGSRYRMLDTVRQYAAARLEAAAERDQISSSHARYYVQLAESLEPRLFGGAADPSALEVIDEEIADIRAVFDHAEDVELKLRLLYAVRWHWFARASFKEAARRSSIAQSLEPGASLHAARARIAAGDVAAWRGEWAALGRALEGVVGSLRRSGDERALSLALALDGMAAAFADDDHQASRDNFAEAVTIAERNGRDAALALIHHRAGLAAQLRGDWAAARAAFEEARAIGESCGHRPALAHALSALGHVAVHERDNARAAASFRPALDAHLEADDRWGVTYTAEGIGLALLGGREAESGTRLLAAASAAWLHLGAGPGRHAAFEAERDERIREALGDDRLRVVLASGAAMSFEAMAALARESVSHLEAPAVVPLRVTALGPLQISRDGQPMEESARSRELLLYLACHPAGRTKEQIGAALWPDADAARIRNNFHVTLHRLRKALGGAEWIVVDGDTYALDRSRGVDLDAETFEREASAALRTSNLRRLEQALRLYRGDFFENGSNGEWSLPVRNRLHDLYARGVETLARKRMEAGDYSGAAEIWQGLVSLDDLDEEAARNLIDCLTRAGDLSAAKRVWRRLADSLKRELGEEPSFRV